MRRVLLFAIFGGMLAAPMMAQNASVRGTVLEEGVDAPVVGAHIYVEELKKGTVSDAKGQFELNELPAGSYNIVISNVGFENS
jgi:hypothetical protein